MGTNQTGAWDDEQRVKRLKDLWEKGESCSTVAAALTREFPGYVAVSRNAVIGKVMRLGLNPHDEQTTRRKCQVAGRKGADAAKAKKNHGASTNAKKANTPWRAPANPNGSKPAPPPPSVPMTETACTLDGLNGKRCTFTLDAKRDGEWLFCGAPAEARGKGNTFVLCDCHVVSYPAVKAKTDPATGVVTLAQPCKPGMFSTRVTGGKRLTPSELARSLRRYI